MYHAIVRRRARRTFARLSVGDWQSVVDDAADDVHHVFPGEHALGGERHSREALARWLQRTYRLLPALTFDIHRVASRGWPWSTWVAIEWADHGTAADGEAYANEGAHWIHLRWGKATYVHAYLDSQRVADACGRMAAHGIEEASAPPIT